MAIIKTLNFGKATVNINDESIPKTLEDYKKNLKTMYDNLNEIFKDKPKCFYTKSEIENLKNKQPELFI